MLELEDEPLPPDVGTTAYVVSPVAESAVGPVGELGSLCPMAGVDGADPVTTLVDSEAEPESEGDVDETVTEVELGSPGVVTATEGELVAGVDDITTVASSSLPETAVGSPTASEEMSGGVLLEIVSLVPAVDGLTVSAVSGEAV